MSNELKEERTSKYEHPHMKGTSQLKTLVQVVLLLSVAAAAAIRTSKRREPSCVTYGRHLLRFAPFVFPRVAMSRRLVSGVLVASLVLVAGCTMKKVENCRPAALPASVGSWEQNGLRLTVSPMLDRAETKKYFGLNALDAGILILRLHVTNGSPSSTVLLLKTNMTLVADGGSGQEDQRAQKIERSSSAGDVLGTAGAAAMSMPLLYVSVKLISDASVIQQSFMKNEFRDQTLSPGRSVDGFLYFKVDPQRTFTRDTLVIRIPQQEGQQDSELRIPIVYESH